MRDTLREAPSSSSPHQRMNDKRIDTRNDNLTKPRKSCPLLTFFIYVLAVVVTLTFLYNILIVSRGDNKANLIGVVSNVLVMILFSIMLWKM